MLSLRPHQAEVVQKIHEGFEAGHRCQLLYAPTGFGKTEVAMAIMKEVARGYKRTAMVLDRIVLVDQTSMRLSRYKIEHGVMMSGHWRFRPHERIQICSAQTLERRGSKLGIDLLIVDECFPGDTLIETPFGPKRIDKIKDGEVIYNATGVGSVRSVFSKTVFNTVILRLSDGTKLECTSDHPVFTELGWRPAGSLERGAKLFRHESVRALWEGDPSFSDQLEAGGIDTGGRNFIQQAAFLRKLLCEEVEQPNAQCRDSKESIGHDQAHRTQTEGKRGQWDWIDANRKNVTCEADQRLGFGVCGENTQTTKSGISASLQIGSGIARTKTLPGVGRGQSRPYQETTARSKEGSIAPYAWVESVQVVKHEGGRNVFNLRVGGHPSYFANGFLVHNCHVQRKSTTDLIKNNPNMRVVGLTATPFTKGLGDTYTHVVGARATGELIQEGWLTPLRVFIAKEIDMKGATKVAGEWSQDQVSERGMKITGDIVAEWITKTNQIFGKPVKTVVFCAGVAHGKDLERQFKEQGYNFVSISYKEDDEFKRLTIEDFARPDTTIHGLIATDILTKGFDVPDVMIGVSARPFSKSFSSHVQQMGRIMRPYPDKKYGVWLDHSGNYLRFREDWDKLFDEGVTELTKDGEKAKKEPTDREKKDSKCPACSSLWTAKDNVCVHCGYQRPVRHVASVAGEMTELEAKTSNMLQERQQFYSELLYYARMRGYKDGYSAVKYKEKFGAFPRGLQQVPRPPSQATMNWIRAKNIAWAKSKARL